jgi:hypothetical protein
VTSVVLAAALSGLAGCGMALREEAIPEFIPTTTIITNTPETTGENGEVDGPSAFIPPGDFEPVPSDGVTTGTSPMPPYAEERKEQYTLEELAELLEASPPGFCRAVDLIGYHGASVANVGSTLEALPPTLDREQQAFAIDQMRKFVAAGREVVRLIPDSPVGDVDTQWFSALLEEIARIADAEPADGDARQAFTAVLQEYGERTGPFLLAVVEECPDGLLDLLIFRRQAS